MRLSAKPTGASGRGLLAGMQTQTELAVTAGMRGTATGLLAAMRAEIAGAFPNSRRLPTAITGRAYPDRAGAASLSASAVVRARSPGVAEVLSSHEGSVIRPRGKRYLAVPTKEVPRIGGRRLTPAQVESRYGQKLELLPAGKLGGGQKYNLLVLRAGRLRVAGGAGRARSGRLATRQVRRLHIFFVLMSSVQLRKRLAPEAIGREWAARAPLLMEAAYETLSRSR